MQRQVSALVESPTKKTQTKKPPTPKGAIVRIELLSHHVWNWDIARDMKLTIFANQSSAEMPIMGDPAGIIPIVGSADVLIKPNELQEIRLVFSVSAPWTAGGTPVNFAPAKQFYPIPKIPTKSKSPIYDDARYVLTGAQGQWSGTIAFRLWRVQ